MPEFTEPYPPEQPPGAPFDGDCGHRHPPGQPCWATEEGEACIHGARCRFCGGGMTQEDEHDIEPGPPTDARIHKECLVSEGNGLTFRETPLGRRTARRT